VVTTGGQGSNGVLLLVTNGSSSAACSQSLPYNFRRAITVDHTRIPNTDQSNFPLLISGTYSYLATVAHGGNVQNANGYDIIFTSDVAGLNRLDHEIESYNPVTGAINFWVRIPALSHTADTGIYIQYGNSSITTSQENKPGVWSNGYAAVWHLSKNGTITAADSTGINSGMISNVTAASGEIAGAGNFNGSTSSYIRIPASSSFKPAGAITLEGWLYPTSANSWNTAIGLDYRADGTWISPLWSYGLGLNGTTQGLAFSIATGGSQNQLLSTGNIPLNAWSYVAGTFDTSTHAQNLYINGVTDSTLVNNGAAIDYKTSQDLVLGQRSPYATGYPWFGLLDEIRISTVARSADWIATEYLNESSPSAFYAVGAENAVTVKVSPASTQLLGGQAQQFAANVTGTLNTAVTWSISPSAVGTVSTAGLYTAPATVSTQQIVTVTATSVDDTSKAASATVTLNPPVAVSITPAVSMLGQSQTQQFTATVANTSNTAVTWSISPAGTGSISSSGFYSAPATISTQQTVMVTATSVADGTKSASATITLSPPVPPVIGALTPASGQVGTTITIAGHNFTSTAGTVTFNGQLASISSWTDTSIMANVPSGATSGNVVVTIAGQASNAFVFTVYAGSLTGSYGSTPTAVTLTSPIAIDWAHWGTSSDAPLVRNTGTLPDFIVIGPNAPAQFSDGEIEYIWTDGDVLPAANRVTSGVLVAGTGNGFHLSVPADTTPRTLTLYLGAFEAQGQLSASMSDSSAAVFTDSSVDIVPGNGDHHVNGVYTLSFQAGQSGQTLNIDYVLAVDHGATTGISGNVTLQSAVLTAQQPSVTLTSPSDGQLFTVPSDVSLLLTATQSGASIANITFVNDSLTAFTLTSPPYTATLSGLSSGDHLLSATATDVNGLSATSAPVLISEVGSGGVLTASVDTPVSVDLSAGSSDWVHWGNSVPDRKAGIAPQISDFKTLANGSSHSFDGLALNGVSYSWTSGAPTDTQTGTSTQMRMQAFKNGFSLTVAADTTLRTLKLYVASGYGQSTLRASLSDGSAAPFVRTTSLATAFAEKVYTIQFQAASAGQTLTITDQVTRDDGFAYVALESASVSDQSPLQISSVSPATAAPGAQITISGSNFGPAQGSAQVTIGNTIMNVVSWSDTSVTVTVPLAPSGAVIVSRGLANSNGVPFAVILPPPPVIASINPTAGNAGTMVTIFGSNFVAAQNNSTITFNGMAATPVSWSNTQILVPAPAGVHTGPVVVTTVSGASNGVVFTFSPGIRFSVQPLYVTPDEVSLQVGGTRAFNAVDPSGNPVTDATWSVDTTSLATITADTTATSSASLQALAPGEVTITATSSLGTAQAKATIYPVGELPAGTPSWSFFPQTQNGHLGNRGVNFVKALRYSLDDPYIYVPASERNVDQINALDDDGNLKWRVILSPTDPANSEAADVAALGANDGGLVVETSECCSSFPLVFTHFAPNGSVLWTYQTPSNSRGAPAMGPDGTIYFSSTGSDSFIGLDDATGQEKFRISPGVASSYQFVSSEDPSSTPCAQFPGVSLPPLDFAQFTSLPLVGADGNAYVLSVGTNVNYNYNSCQVQKRSTDPAPPLYQITQIMGTLNFNESIALIRITPSGDVSEFPVTSVSYSGGARWQGSWFFDDPIRQLPFVNFDKFAPDGLGGMLVTWNQRTSEQGALYHGMLSRVLDGNVTYTVMDGAPAQTNIFAPAPTVGDIASNDQGTAFFDTFDFSSLSHVTTAVNVLTGTPNWISNTGLIAATDDGGVIAQDGEGIKNLNTSGIPSPAGVPDLGDFAYLDTGIYTYLNAYNALSVIREPLPQTQQTQPQKHKTISNGYAITKIGHTANRIAPLSPANFTPVANCTGFDGDDSFGLTHGALMVPQNGSNSLQLATTSAPISLVAQDSTLIASISPSFFTPADKNIVITITAAPGKTGGTWINFQKLDATMPAGKAFFVAIYPKLNKSVASFKVVAPASGRFPELAPDDAWIPTQPALEAYLNQIYETQVNVHFTVNSPNLITSAYDFSPQDGTLNEPVRAALDPIAQLAESKKIDSDVGSNIGFDANVYFVRTLKSGTSASVAGYAYFPEAIAKGLPFGVFVAQFSSSGQCGICEQTVLANQFPMNTVAHELGHHFGLYPGPNTSAGRHYPDSDDPFHLMSARGDFLSLQFGSGACELNFYEWEQLHGKPNSDNVRH
jgi:hypothetical protein